MQQNESRMQVAIVHWFAVAYPKYYPMFFAIENKRKTKSVRHGGILKAQGVKSGVADLCLALRTEQYGALYLELKHGKNLQTDNQIAFQQACKQFGNDYQIAYTFDAAIAILTNHVNSYRKYCESK